MAKIEGHRYLYDIQESELMDTLTCFELIGRDATQKELGIIAAKRCPSSQRTEKGAKYEEKPFDARWTRSVLHRHGDGGPRHMTSLELHSLTTDDVKQVADPRACNNFFEDLRVFEAERCKGLPYCRIQGDIIYTVTETVFHCSLRCTDMGAICCARADGKILPVKLWIPEKEEPQHWRDVQRVVKEDGSIEWTYEKKEYDPRWFLIWFMTYFIPFIQRNNTGQRVLLILAEEPWHHSSHGFAASGRDLLPVIAEDYNISLLYMPKNTAFFLQPLERRILTNFHAVLQNSLDRMRQEAELAPEVIIAASPNVAEPVTPRQQGLEAAREAVACTMQPDAIQRAFAETGLYPIDQSKVQAQIDICRRLRSLENAPCSYAGNPPVYTPAQLALVEQEHTLHRRKLHEFQTSMDDCLPLVPRAKRQAGPKANTTGKTTKTTENEKEKGGAASG